MAISIEVTGLAELIKQCEVLATPRELEETDKKAIKKCVDITKQQVESAMRVSKDVTKSGRKDSRTYTHSKDALITKITKKDGKIQGVIQVGDGKGNNPWFYTKFDEFDYGNSKYPPSKPWQNTFKKLRKQWEEIFIKEYEELVKKLEG